LRQSRLKQGEEGRVTDFSKCNDGDGDGDDEDEYEDEDNIDEGLFALDLVESEGKTERAEMSGVRACVLGSLQS
jgi:hypothetical protein